MSASTESILKNLANNKAAFIPFEKASKFEVKDGPVPTPGEDEVVIKVHYAAVNPTDWKMQDTPYIKMPYPFIFGVDVAGTIIHLPSSITSSPVPRLHLNQRVIAHCDSLLTQKATNAAFQTYTTVREILVSPVPDDMPLKNAVVLPLGLDTAVTGLYKNLGMGLPMLKGEGGKEGEGKRILIWGGSSSVGSCAIQLAKASNYTPLTTCSPHNFTYVQSLGASQAFDYSSPTLISDILAIMKEGDLVLDCIGTDEAQRACVEIQSKIGGGTVPTVLWPIQDVVEGVKVELIMGLAPGFTDLDLGDAIWRKYLPEALARGEFLAKPDPFVIEGGLEKVQEGVDLLRKGVSAKKVVIEILRE